MRGHYTVHGFDTSAATRKLEAVVRYKGLPYEYRHEHARDRQKLEQRAGSRELPVLETPEGWFLHDTSAICMLLERLFPETPVLPATPVQRMVCHLIEDWADHWLIRPALHFRWCRERDARERGLDFVHDLTAAPREGPLPRAERVQRDELLERVIARGRRSAEGLAAGEERQDEMEFAYLRFLDLLSAHVQRHRFLLGGQPCLADFALFGVIEAHFAVDPTPREIAAFRAGAIFAYARRVCEARFDLVAAAAAEAPASPRVGWLAGDTISISLLSLIEVIAQGYHQFLEANHAALKSGAEDVSLDLGFGRWTVAARRDDECRRVVLADRIASLGADDRRQVQAMLDPLGAWSVYEIPPLSS
ncbi:MAG: glutathione S-transferase family protein [Deltaproteobacteria bacterium]|nr:glutathione S-transferase family protein [Deltaproteobacteria bacterium]MBW2421102.1 glutathione S-transferase family protein [Deltaproteobacteria bacterium]